MKIDFSTKFEELTSRLQVHSNKNQLEFDLINMREPLIFISMDLETETRSMYIDITEENLDSQQIDAFPKWSGIDISQRHIQEIGIVLNKTYLIISKTKDSSSEVFEFVLQNLMDNMILKTASSLYVTIYKVLETWHNFFKTKHNKRLTLEQEMGLFGELYYIKKWLALNEKNPPLIIHGWKGPHGHRVDFETIKKGIEIKTFDSEKRRNEITIASEKQLELTKGQTHIQLYVLKLSQCEESKLNIKILIGDIEQILLKNSPNEALHFKELLMEVEIGLLEKNYPVQDFEIEEEFAYQVTNTFPKITPDVLTKGVLNVSYTIDLSHCEDFKIEIDQVYK